MTGWISIHRSIRDHWVWQDAKYLKWWLTILLNVNHEGKKFPVGTEIKTCSPGQSFRSIDQWSAMFSCSKPTTIKFFEMLKNDNMISTEIMGKGNRRKHLLTVVNWSKYQQTETENFTETVPETLPKQYWKLYPNVPPNNNDNNIPTNVGSENPQDLSRETTPERKINYQEVVNLFHQVCKSFPRVKKLTDARKAKIRIRVNELKKQFPGTDHQTVLQELFTKMEASEFLRGNNKNGWKASFDWIFENGKNWVKVYEGNYDHSPVNGKSQPELFTPKIPEL